MRNLGSVDPRLRDSDTDIRLTTIEAMHRLVLRHMDEPQRTWTLFGERTGSRGRFRWSRLISTLRQIGADIPSWFRMRCGLDAQVWFHQSAHA